MKSESVATINREVIINTAAFWKSREELPEIGDPNYLAFVNVMKYRREIAIRYLKSDDDVSREVLYNILENCNENIKQILGL